MPQRDLDIFTRCCGHIEASFLDREFVRSEWPTLRAQAWRSFRRATGERAFRRVMTDLVEKRLPLSHCRFVTPELGAAIRRRAAGAVPSVLRTRVARRGDVLYLRLASFSTPPFSLEAIRSDLARTPRARMLILDMRLNVGGSSCAAGEFIGLLDGPDVHYLTSRLPDWRRHLTPTHLRAIPAVENADYLRELESLSSHPHAEWRTRREARRVFPGRVVLLVGRRTGSCGELVAQVLADSRGATVLGEPTAGACVGAREFDCGHGYAALLPFVWLLAPGPVRLEGRPLRPHRQYAALVPDTRPLPPAEIARIATSVRAEG